MSDYKIVLAGAEYPLGAFTLGDVSRAAVLFKQIKDLDTQEAVNAQNTIVHIGLQSAGYQGDFKTFLEMKGVSIIELINARTQVGLAIGYLELKEKAPGEGQGAVSP